MSSDSSATRRPSAYGYRKKYLFKPKVFRNINIILLLAPELPHRQASARSYFFVCVILWECARAPTNKSIVLFLFSILLIFLPRPFHAGRWGWVVLFHSDVCLLKCRRGDDTRCGGTSFLWHVKRTLNIGCGPLFLSRTARTIEKIDMMRARTTTTTSWYLFATYASQMMRKTKAGGGGVPKGEMWKHLNV